MPIADTKKSSEAVHFIFKVYPDRRMTAREIGELCQIHKLLKGIGDNTVVKDINHYLRPEGVNIQSERVPGKKHHWYWMPRKIIKWKQLNKKCGCGKSFFVIDSCCNKCGIDRGDFVEKEKPRHLRRMYKKGQSHFDFQKKLY